MPLRGKTRKPTINPKYLNTGGPLPVASGLTPMFSSVHFVMHVKDDAQNRLCLYRPRPATAKRPGQIPSRTFSAILPALLFSLFFLLPAWLLWQRELRQWAAVPFAISLLLLGLTIAIKLQDVNRTQAIHDVNLLLRELPREDLWLDGNLVNAEEQLFLASTASQALYRALPFLPERRGAIDSALYRLAEWTTRQNNLRQWGRGADWDRELFFLAHAGAVLGHYQLATSDEESFGPSLRAIGSHLGKRLQRGRYKHLISRDNEEFFRPADNAAALYTLSLYDRNYATEFLEPTFQDWSDYITHELHYAESRLPCAAFSTTNRCQLEPSATATGLYIAYRAAAAPARVDSDIPWREWLHYFGKGSLSPWSMSVRSNMRAGQETASATSVPAPLDCNRYENAIGLWAAAEYGADYTYFRLFATSVLHRWFYDQPDYTSQRPARRISELTRVALRAVGKVGRAAICRKREKLVGELLGRLLYHSLSSRVTVETFADARNTCKDRI